jgi:hypothetical protein
MGDECTSLSQEACLVEQICKALPHNMFLQGRVKSTTAQ